MNQVYAVLLALLSAPLISGVYAQCLIQPVALEQRLEAASEVFEGEVKSSESFIDPETGNILTSHIIEVYGGLQQKSVIFNMEVITAGGVVDGLAQRVYPSLHLKPGDHGIFICKESDNNRLKPVASAQGFLKFDIKEGVARDQFNTYSIEELIPQISSATGKQWVQLKERKINDPSAASPKSSIQITSVSPDVLTAGTQTEVVIQGSGFGNVQGLGTVSFRNADDGGNSFINAGIGPHYISWTDTEIRLYLPTYQSTGAAVAGSGNIKVTTNLGYEVQSTDEIDVQFARNEMVAGNELQNIYLTSTSEDGSLQFTFNSALNENAGAKMAFRNALNNWRCNSSFNSFVDTTQTSPINQAVYDGINLVSFDQNELLPMGVLATTIVTLASCNSTEGQNWKLYEADMIFNPGYDWWIQEGAPPPGSYDFESVVLHELGHAHLLQHVNNPGAVMYYTLTDGQSKRFLSVEGGINGGLHVLESSMNSACGNGYAGSGPEGCLSHLATSIEDELNAEEVEFTIYPNPNNGNFNLKLDHLHAAKAMLNIYSASGALVWNGRVQQNINTISLQGLDAGLYIAEVITEHNSFRDRFIIR